MGRQWPHESIPDSAHLPGGAYLLEIGEIEETHPRESEKLMYVWTFSVAEPAQFAGLQYYENFVIGTDQDPNADDPATWQTSVGARIMKRVIKAAQVEIMDDIDETLAAAKGQQVIGIITEQVDDGTRDARYKGRLRNSSAGWYAPGEQEIGLDDGTPRAAAPAAPTKPRPAAPTRPGPTRPAPAPAPAAARAAAPAARPAAPAARPPAPAARPAARAVKSDTVKCTICNKPIPREEFVEHVEGHEREE